MLPRSSNADTLAHVAGPTVEWLEPFSPTASGVDHLGMRVAGEQAYAKLIDFTTTVSYRPRYFSFLCWALERAFAAAGGREGAIEHLVDPAIWRRVLKRYDFAMAAATLAADPAAERIGGLRKIKKLLQRADDGDTISLSDDHLRAPHGSFDTYAGSMYNLRLLRVAGGVTRPSALGMTLAAAFERTLQACGGAAPLGATMIPSADLLRIGQRCGISRLSAHDEVVRTEVQAEREALRSVIVDLDGLRAQEGAATNRLCSIGLILRLHQMTPTPGLREFRTTTLLDGLRTAEEVVSLGMPPIYDRVRAHWRIYQAHAYATLALEALLSLVIEQAFQLQPTLGEVLPTERVVEGVLALLVDGRTDAAGEALLDDGWWDGSLDVLLSGLDGIVARRREAEVAEPELSETIYRLFEDNAAAAHDACLLFLLSCERMRSLLQADGHESWTGENDPLRLPPIVLVERLEEALHRQQTVREFLRDVIFELVIHQHRKIALRKLAADPSRDTSEVLLEAGGMIPLASHSVGTSNPRYLNAVMALTDLGYLTPEGAVTADGEELLGQIARAGAL